MAAGDVEVNLVNPLAKRCASFDGVDDGAQRNNFILNLIPEHFTKGTTIYCEAMINEDVSTGETSLSQRIFTLRNLSGSSWLGIGYGNSQVSTIIRKVTNDTQGNILLNPPERNKWYKFTITYDPTEHFKFYVDNVYISSSDNESFSFDTFSGDGLSLGCLVYNIETTSGAAKCFLRNFKVYGRVLTTTEITKLNNGGHITDGLRGFWKMDKDYTDSSGNGFDLTPTGSYFTAVDEELSEAIKDDRTGANDKHLISVINNKIMTAHIEET